MKVNEIIDIVFKKIANLLNIEVDELFLILAFTIVVPFFIGFIRIVFNCIASLSSEHSKESAFISAEDISEISSSELESDLNQLKNHLNELVRHSNECETIDMYEREYTTKLPKYNRK